MKRRALGLIVLIGLFASCSSGAPASRDGAAAQPPTASPASTGPSTSTPLQPPTSIAPAPHPTLTEAGLREELDRAPFDHRDWKTDFTKRTVRLNDFLGGGPPKDGIPAIDNPDFISVAEADKWLEDPEAVEAVNINGDARGYPQRVLVWHEIVNDVVGGDPVAVTF